MRYPDLKRALHYPREVAILAFVVVSALAIPRFWDPSNLTNVLSQTAPILMLAVGQSFVLLARGIDMSQGAQVGLLSVCFIVVANFVGPALALLIVVLVGAASAFAVGVAIVRTRTEPFVATLGLMYVLIGTTMYWTEGAPVSEIADDTRAMLYWLGTANIGVIPVSFLIAAVLAALGHVFLRHTMAGLRLVATGSNPDAARRLGISRSLVFGVAYALCTVYTIAGVLLLTSRIRQGDPHLGEGILFDSIGGAVLGGVMLSGGVGGVWAATRGVIMLLLIQNALYLTDLNSYVRDIAVGVIILAGVVSAQLGKKETRP